MLTLKRCRWLRAGEPRFFFVGVVLGDCSCVFLSTTRLVLRSCSAFNFIDGERSDCLPSATAVAHSVSTRFRTEQGHDVFSRLAEALCSAFPFAFSPGERPTFLHSQTGEEHFERSPFPNTNERSVFSSSHTKDEQDEPSPSKTRRGRSAFHHCRDAEAGPSR